MSVDDVLALFVDPSPRRRELDGEAARHVALAYLIDGQLDQYDQRASASDLPVFNDSSTTESRTGIQGLVTALGMLLTGDPAALDHLRQLQSQDSDDETITLGLILESLLVSDSGRPDLAIEPIRRRLEHASTELERALLVCQLGLRTLEAGEFGANDLASEPGRTFDEAPDDALRALYLVAAHNRFQHEWLSSGRPSTAFLPPRSQSRVLSGIDGLAADATNRYLSDSFKAFFTNPYTRTYSFIATDQITQGLSSAILRSEFIGDFQALIRFRGLLGKYHLLSDAGRGAKVAGHGFSLVRRAHDANAIGEAGRIYRDVGPLEALRDAAVRSITAPWFPLEVRSHLKLLSAGVDVFTDDEVEAGTRRLIENFDGMTAFVPGAGWIADAATEALAAGAHESAIATQNSVAGLILTSLARDPDPLLHQAIPRVVHALNWHDLPTETIRAGLDAIASHLDPPTDRTFVAVALCRVLVRVEPEAVASLVRAAYDRGQSPLIGSLISQLDLDVDNTALEQLARQYAAALDKNREDASRGAYSMGILNLGATSAELAIRAQDDSLFVSLLSYLRDPNAPPHDRRAIAAVLAQHPSLVPAWLSSELAQPLAPVDVPFPIFGSQPDIDIASLELSAAFGSADATFLETAVLTLAASDDSAVRLDVARLVSRGVSNDSVRLDFGRVVLLMLAVDREPAVRAQAGYGLARMLVREATDSSLIEQRLWSLATEPGAATPHGVWAGVAQAARDGHRVPVRFAEHAPDVARSHLSRRVRRAAEKVVDSLDNGQASGAASQ